MSDISPHEHEAPPYALDSVTNLAAAHYAKLLFGRGAAGWVEYSEDRFIRIVIPLKDTQFTAHDYQIMCEMLDNECGIKITRPFDKADKYNMVFTLSGDEVNWLREYGIGEHDAGKLLRAEQSYVPRVIDETKIHPEPHAVLYNAIKTAMFANGLKGWQPFTPAKGKQQRMYRMEFALAPQGDYQPSTDEAIAVAKEMLRKEFGVKQVAATPTDQGFALEMTRQDFGRLDYAVKEKPESTVTHMAYLAPIVQC
ncbi:MAG: hypothetical protein K2X09_01115, partial [Rickettsiales bacterium]|nr:hypothetical protein [Rickettsiales bacterium]